MDLYLVIIGIAFFLGPVVLTRFLKAAKEAALQKQTGQSAQGLPAQSRSRTPKQPSLSEQIAPLLREIEALEKRALTMSQPLPRELANRRFHEPLTTYVPERLQALRRGLQAGAELRSAQAEVASMEVVLDEIEALISQRRDDLLRPELGDADALALACYTPISIFARAEGLPHNKLAPVTQLGPFEMSTWTGFAPTSLAPIFLPEDFFQRAVWWPAIGHEIAHDFLVSVEGLEARLREEHGFLPFHLAYRPIDFNQGFSDADIQRVVGAWFEELFCDVFGTMMCGPAYVTTMIELFAAKEDPREVLVVGVDPDRRGYDCHPPAHLRVHLANVVLDRAGFHRDVLKLRSAWAAKNNFASLSAGGAEDNVELYLLFPTGDGYIRVALEPFITAIEALAIRLYAGPLKSLSGMGLRDISGLDYGPHEHQDAARAKASLLEGRVPKVRDVRAVIAGAVMAGLERRGQELQILELARRAIPAVGTYEIRPDAYNVVASRAEGLSVDAGVLRDAVVLREILKRPGERKERR